MGRLRFLAKVILVFVAFAFAKLILLDIPKLAFSNPRLSAYMAQQGIDGVTEWIPYDQFPRHIISMVVATEDARFWEHRGVDWLELNKAILEFKKNGRQRGASTITMQLSRNLFLSENRSILRKGLEILIALEMDFLLKKERILEIYLNVVEFGDGFFGVAEASRHYFNTTTRNLNPQQGAFLIAILPNPREWGFWPPSAYIKQRMAIIQRRVGFKTRPALTAKKEKSGWEKLKPRPAIPIIPEDETPAEIFLETE